jgi:endonuclease YncB( thermonuclease family)
VTVNNYTFPVTVERVIDGDTIVGIVDVGFRVSLTLSLRIYGIDAPELPTVEGKAAAAAVVTFLGWTPTHHPVVAVKTHAPGTNAGADKYGRWLGEVRLADDSDLASRMIADGYAVPYFGGTR